MNSNEMETWNLATELQRLLVLPPVMVGGTAAAAILRMALPVVGDLKIRAAGREAVERDLEIARTAGDSAVSLQKVFLADAEVRESRALHNYASVKLDRALLQAQIASAISRGHLPNDFYSKLKDWTK